MRISIANEMKKRFHAACGIRGLKMSQLVVALIEQWLKTNDVSGSGVEEHKFVTIDKISK